MVLADLNDEAAAQTATTSKDCATNPAYTSLVIKLDVADRAAYQHAVETIIARYSRIDYFVNAAGVGCSTDLPIGQSDSAEFARLHNVNTVGILNGVAAVGDAMNRQDERFVNGRSGRRSIGKGAIVNLASVAGMIAVPTHVQYVASKYAARGIVKTTGKYRFPPRRENDG